MTETPQGAWLYRLARLLLRIGLTLWNRIRIEGLDHVPMEGGCIVASNHVSFLDPPIVGGGCLKREIRFVARDTLFKPGLGAWLMTGVNCIPLDRTRGDVSAMRSILRVLSGGEMVGLFPEGTRSPDGTLQSAKPGIGFLVAKAAVPVVPVYISGSYRAYPRHARFIRPWKVKVTYGPPIHPDEVAALGRGRDGYEKVGELVMDRIRALQNTAV